MFLYLPLLFHNLPFTFLYLPLLFLYLLLLFLYLLLLFLNHILHCISIQNLQCFRIHTHQLLWFYLKLSYLFVNFAEIRVSLYNSHDILRPVRT